MKCKCEEKKEENEQDIGECTQEQLKMEAYEKIVQ